MRVQRYIWALNLLLVAAAALLLVRLFREDAAPLPVPAPPPDAARSLVDPGERHGAEREAAQAIADRDLFGTRTQEPSPEPPEPEPPPEPAPLRLRLVGTISGPPELARAVIEDLGSRSQNMYRIGDIVQGARIKGIDRDRVVLDLAGRETVLSLHMATGDDAPSTPSPPRRPPSARAAPADPHAISEVARGHFEVEPEAFLSSGGVAGLLRAVELRPHVVDGETKGLLVASMEEGSLAQLAGVRSGDVIQTVNGQFLNSLPKAFQVMRKARTQETLDMEIMREGQGRTLSFKMR